jgi:hypothetical protein
MLNKVSTDYFRDLQQNDQREREKRLKGDKEY